MFRTRKFVLVVALAIGLAPAQAGAHAAMRQIDAYSAAATYVKKNWPEAISAYAWCHVDGRWTHPWCRVKMYFKSGDWEWRATEIDVIPHRTRIVVVDTIWTTPRIVIRSRSL